MLGWWCIHVWTFLVNSGDELELFQDSVFLVSLFFRPILFRLVV